jgi:prephenate dehydrogenase
MSMEMLPPHVGIVGLGLMGGSLARDLVARGVRVTAFDRDPSLRGELEGPGPHRLRLVDSAAGVLAAPVVVIAVPVVAALDVLAELAPGIGPSHLIMDVGSTKAAIVQRAESLGIGRQFVGCHPLAGDHRSGWTASRPDLFNGAPVFVCASSDSAPDALALATAFWTALGGCVQTLTAADHDRRMALVSHLPHMMSVALALTLRHAGMTHDMLGPGGRDVTRLASGSAQVWSQIAAQNRESLVTALAAFEIEARELRTAMEAGETTAVAALLQNAAAWTAE